MKYYKIAVLSLFVSLAAIFSSCQKTGEYEQRPNDEISLRELVGRYYLNNNFSVGANAAKNMQATQVPDSVRTIFMSEFSMAIPDSVFSQALVMPQSGGAWDNQLARQWVDKARKQKVAVMAKLSLGANSSEWVSDTGRTDIELGEILDEYTTKISTEVQGYKDVVKYMIITDNFFDKSVSNPWMKLGESTFTYLNEDIEVPNYIVSAVKAGVDNAPDIKRMIVCNENTLDFQRWDEVKKSILALRAAGLRIDAIGWTGSVAMGWEKNVSNSRNLQIIIDWCYLNNVEFHITGLEVLVSTKEESAVEDIERVEATREQVAATMKAIVNYSALKVGRGVVSVNFGELKGRFDSNVGTYSNIFNKEMVKVTAYDSVKEAIAVAARN